jgi:hypothetical protein
MKRNRVLALIGFLLYVGSFFLTAVKIPKSDSLAGYWCAYITLILPWGHDGFQTFHEQPLRYFSVLFSGWINPLFLITAAFLWVKPQGRAGAFLRILVVLLLPACWGAFHYETVSPWIGYWVWTAAMLMVLFSTMLARQDRAANTAAVAA